MIQDHPRTRGEKVQSGAISYTQAGSPPHTRGKEPDIIIPTEEEGITPAHAGKSTFAVLVLQMPEDHPRTRGEKYSATRTLSPKRGSPPHTRGKARENALKPLHDRITPAHAGKSKVRKQPDRNKGDHPRTRGEKCRKEPFPPRFVGSPPHTRGKALIYVSSSSVSGITPAHAGKSYADLAIEKAAEDHPRTRGEKNLVQLSEVLHAGSPPHTRGKGRFGRFGTFIFGITPAHAGKS